MFLRAVLIVLSAAAFSAAAYAAAPCASHGKAGCQKSASSVSIRAGASSRKEIRPAVRSASGEAAQSQVSYLPAEVLLARSLADRQNRLGGEHPFTLTTENSLAVIYKVQGRYREAENLYRHSLDASERTLGDKHPLTLATAKGLASLYKAEGRHAEAALLNRRTGLERPVQ